VVLDLDDTLFPEREYVVSGFEAVGEWLEKERGIAGFAEAARNAYLSGVRGTIFDSALERVGRADAQGLVPSMIEVYRTHMPRISLFPEVPAVLERLHSVAHLCLITDGPLASQSAKVAALGLEKWFDNICCTDQWGREFWKPAPRAYEQVMAAFPMSEAGCYSYVGDNPAKDFITPRRLGWKCVRVRRAGTHHEHAEPPTPAHSPDVTIQDLSGLAEVLAQIEPLIR
jgi:putative hydrolase of the HAD superfamily